MTSWWRRLRCSGTRPRRFWWSLASTSPSFGCAPSPAHLLALLSFSRERRPFFFLQGTGTPSLGKRQHKKTHTTCRRCGKVSFHKQHALCASCGYPGAHMRQCEFTTLSAAWRSGAAPAPCVLSFASLRACVRACLSSSVVRACVPSLPTHAPDWSDDLKEDIFFPRMNGVDYTNYTAEFSSQSKAVI